MSTALTLIVSVIVALIGIAGQFFISRRTYIPEIRQERFTAYSSFLGTCLKGMYALEMESTLLNSIENDLHLIREEDEEPLRQHISEQLIAYNIEMNLHLAQLQIIAPFEFVVLGRKIIEEISWIKDRKSTKDNFNAAYNAFASRAHADLDSLKKQANKFASLFRGLRELPSE